MSHITCHILRATHVTYGHVKTLQATEGHFKLHFLGSLNHQYRLYPSQCSRDQYKTPSLAYCLCCHAVFNFTKSQVTLMTQKWPRINPPPLHLVVLCRTADSLPRRWRGHISGKKAPAARVSSSNEHTQLEQRKLGKFKV